MKSVTPLRPPERLALLPDPVAADLLTEAFLSGDEPLPHAQVAPACIDLDDDARWDADRVRNLVDEAMDRFADAATDSDAWLAPRLHAALRLARREASNSALWNFLSLRLAPDYVFWRWGTGGTVAPNRFKGPSHTQALSRLWWAAELFRDADDYAPVATACSNQEFVHTLLHMTITQHRPTALALVRLLDRKVVQTTREVVALAKAVNAAGSTLVYEVMAPDIPVDPGAHPSWAANVAAGEIPYLRLPDGPLEGRVPVEAIDHLAERFEEFNQFAAVRGRPVRGGDTDADVS